MPAKHYSKPVKSQTDIPEDEIELIDLLRVIWKWKYLIIGGTFVFGLVAVIISLNMTKIYSVDTIVEPGILNINPANKYSTYISNYAIKRAWIKLMHEN